jgi:hypothetical protein
MASPPPAPAHPRTWHDLAPLVLVVAVFAKALRPLEDPDAFWHLATGRLMWNSHIIPKYDPFSWSGSGRRWIAHEWLTEAMMWPLWRAGRDALLAVVFAVIIAASFHLVRRTAEDLGASRITASGFSFLAAFASAHTFNVRPQMLSLFFTALITRPLLTGGHGKRARFWMVLLLAVWANMHGGFFLGLGLLLAVFGCEVVSWTIALRTGKSVTFPVRTAIIAVASTGATLANPNTFEGLRYPLRYLREYKPMMRYIAEWARPNLFASQYLPFTALLLCTPLLAVAARRRPNLAQFAMLSMVSGLGLTAVRNTPVFCVVVAPVAAAWCTAGLARSRAAAASTATHTPGTPHTPRTPRAARALPTSLGAVAMSATLLGGAGVAATGVRNSQRVANHADLFPSKTLAALQAAPEGRLFNAHDFGGWLIWNRVTVSIDGRSDMYGPKLFLRYIDTWSANPGWQERLREDDVRYVLVEPNSPLGTAMAKDVTAKNPAWRLVATDPTSVLYTTVLYTTDS